MNASPSLTANTREDYDLKFKLLHDVLDLVDMEGRRENSGEHGHGTSASSSISSTSGGAVKSSETTLASSQSISAPLHMGGFDLVWKDGPVPVPTGSSSSIGQKSTYGTMLGADFDKRLNTFATNAHPLSHSINDTLAEKLARKAETIREASQLAASFATKQSPSISIASAAVASGAGSSSSSAQPNSLANRPGLSAMISAFKSNSLRPPSRGQQDSATLSSVSSTSSNAGGERLRPWTVGAGQKRPSTRALKEDKGGEQL